MAQTRRDGCLCHEEPQPGFAAARGLLRAFSEDPRPPKGPGYQSSPPRADCGQRPRCVFAVKGRPGNMIAEFYKLLAEA